MRCFHYGLQMYQNYKSRRLLIINNLIENDKWKTYLRVKLSNKIHIWDSSLVVDALERKTHSSLESSKVDG